MSKGSSLGETSGQGLPHPLRLILLLVLLLSSGLVLLWQVAAGNSHPEVTVEVHGLLLSQAGMSVADQELLMRFYVSPSKPDLEVTATTDSQGKFTFQVTVPQHLYRNSSQRCAEIQGRLYVPGEFAYEPGHPRQMTETGSYESWAPAGRYEKSVLLFHSVREEDDPENTDRFADMTIQLGSPARPLRITGAQSATAVFGLTVKHLAAEAKTLVAEPERYSYTGQIPVSQRTTPKNLSGLAPLQVMVNGEIQAEAEVGRPITTYRVTLPRPSVIQAGQTVGRSEGTATTTEMEVTYYYHQDRDRDGVPDYEIRSQYLTTTGQPLTGHPPVTEIYAYKERYRAAPPTISGYTYQGYQTAAGALQEGVPEVIVAADQDYQYIYEKRTGSGQGNGDSGNGGQPGVKEPEVPPPPDPKEPLNPSEPPVEKIPPGEGMKEPPDGEAAESWPPGEAGDAANDRPEVRAPGSSALEQGASLPPVESPTKRHITFVKMSYQQQVEPGEEIVYHFSGFANDYPYPLKEFTLVDEPDPGLDLLAIAIPPLAQGDEVSYEVECRTNQRESVKLQQGHPANEPLNLEMPALMSGEYLTELSVQFGEVPTGFAQDDELTMIFRVWQEPPADELHNQGFLYYEDQGEKVIVSSGDGPARVTIEAGWGGQPADQAASRQSVQNRQMTATDDFFHGGNKSFFKALAIWLVLMTFIAGGWFAAMEVKKKRVRGD